MNKNKILKKVKEYVKKELGSEPTGHDFWHAFRVWKMAKKIAQKRHKFLEEFLAQFFKE
jgi:uncharacterized protein